jgi:hypothetical protein
VSFHIIDAFDLPWFRAAPPIVEGPLACSQFLARHFDLGEVSDTSAADEEIGQSAADHTEVLDRATEISVPLHDRRLIGVAWRLDKSSSDSRHLPCLTIQNAPFD